MYKIVSAKSTPELERQINELADRGYRLVRVWHSVDVIEQLDYGRKGYMHMFHAVMAIGEGK